MKATIKDLKKEFWLRNRNNGDIVWTTKGGDIISIKDMTDEHLINTINMLERISAMRDIYYENYFEHEDAGERI